MNPPGVEPILPDTVSPGKTGHSFGYEPASPFADNKSHTVSDDPAEADSENDPEEPNS